MCLFMLLVAQNIENEQMSIQYITYYKEANIYPWLTIKRGCLKETWKHTFYGCSIIKYTTCIMMMMMVVVVTVTVE